MTDLKSLAHPDLKPRFLAKVKINEWSGCWDWTASKHRGTYGQFSVGNKPRRAHRVSYELFCGEIPDGLHVLHKCDNRGCVNPKHLFLGTNADNMADKMAKGRQVNVPLEGEANGSAKLTADDVAAIRSHVGLSHRALASKFGISASQVGNILAGRHWRSVYQKQNFGPELK